VAIPGPGSDASVSGISASGDVVLTSHTGRIVFAAGVEGPHVTSGGDQSYATAEVALEGDTILESGGDVSFASLVTGDASLTVNASGTTAFGGDVSLAGLTTDGRGATRIATASVTTTGSQSFGDGVELEQDTTFTAGSTITFGSTLDGPGGAVVRTPGKVTFGGDIGSGTPVAGLFVHDDETDAADIEFTGTRVVRVGSGGIHLNPMDRTSIPDVATVYKQDGELSFETDGSIEVGHLEKISVGGNLGLTAGSVRVGDVNALSLAVAAGEIEIMPRAPGPVLRADGSTVTDDGTAVIANTMVFSSTPQIDADFAGPDDGVVTLASQSGEVRTPGPSLAAFDVRLINTQGAALTVEDFVNPNGGAALDLVATGSPATDDAATAIPRRKPSVVELTHPKFGTDQPVAATARPAADEVLAFLDCADVGGAAAPACLAPVAGGGGAPLADFDPVLATERARQATVLYRRLVGPGEASQQLRAAYDRAVDDYRSTRWAGEIDGAEFYRYVARSPGHAAALQTVDQLATLFVELQLLDLGRADLQQLRETIARQFLEQAQPGGLDAGALLDAVDASRIGVPS
jgi:hypothetical protein